jgi:hypothetical protein
VISATVIAAPAHTGTCFWVVWGWLRWGFGRFRNQEVGGSIPPRSTNLQKQGFVGGHRRGKSALRAALPSNRGSLRFGGIQRVRWRAAGAQENGIHEVAGSIPTSSTNFDNKLARPPALPFYRKVIEISMRQAKEITVRK